MKSFLLVSRCLGQGSHIDLGLVLWFQSHFNFHSLCGVVLVLGFLVSLGLLLVPAGLPELPQARTIDASQCGSIAGASPPWLQRCPHVQRDGEASQDGPLACLGSS